MTASSHPSTDLPDLVAETCFCQALQSAGRAVARRFDESLRCVGLTSWQFSLLMVLDRAEPPTMGAVAVGLAADRTTVTANLKPLLRRGLVEVLRDEGDGRSRRVALTPGGRTVLAEAVERWRVANDAIAERLTGFDPDDVRAALRAIARS